MINQLYSSVFIEEGGWTRYKQISRVNSANNCSKKLGTLTDSARADGPHHQCGPSSLGVGPFARSFFSPTTPNKIPKVQ